MIRILLFIMALTLNAETKEAYLSLSSEVRREIDKQMASLSVQIDTNVDNMYNDVQEYAQSNIGLSKKQTVANLEAIQKESGGLFDDAIRGMTGAITDKTFTVSEDIFFGELLTEEDYLKANESKRYTWIATLVNTCPSCLPLHGRTTTMRGWKSTGGVPNERNTICTRRKGSACHCSLVPSDVLPSRSKLREPIKIQAKRIRKMEKKRGKKYAPSTKKGFLGQINNPKSRTADLRKIKRVKK